MTWKNTLRGKRAKAIGALFENIFFKSCLRTGIGITRIPDSCKRIRTDTLVQIKSPFDWICTYQGQSAFIDTKTIDHDAFSHSMISEHQVKALRMHENKGAIAGYVIWFRPADIVLFVPAKVLESRMQRVGSIRALPEEKDPNTIYLGKQMNFDVRILYSPYHIAELRSFQV